jgi:hypothetical protein
VEKAEEEKEKRKNITKEEIGRGMNIRRGRRRKG